MKFILPFIVVTFLINTAHSSHIIGGTIQYTFISSNSTSSIYSISIELYNDCLNSQPVVLQSDSIIQIGIYNMDKKSLYTKKTFFRKGLYRSNGCNSIPLCIDIGRYTDTVQLKFNTNGYNLTYERCCRASYVANLTGNTNGITLFAHLNPNHGSNNSPINYYQPKFINEVNITNTDFGAVDVDGDSLVFSLVTPFSGGSMNDPVPQVNPSYIEPSLVSYIPKHSLNRPFGDSSSINVNGVTGKLIYKSKVNGSFVLCTEVKEYRKGKLIGITRRELLYIFFNTDPNIQNTSALILNKPIYLQNKTFRLSWNMCHLAVKGYTLERKTASTNWETIQTNSINEPFDDTISIGKVYNYRVKATVNNNTTVSNIESAFIPTAALTSINKNIISVHPNPFDTEIQFDFKGSQGEGVLKLYNSFGVLLKEIQITNADQIINTSGFSNGLYYVEITDNHGYNSIQKLIKLGK